MRRIKYIGMFFLLTAGKIFAGTDSLYDTSRISPANLPQQPSKIYTGKDFIYEEPIQEPNILTQFILWAYHKIIEFLNNTFHFDFKPSTFSGREVLWVSLVVLFITLITIGIIFFYKKFNKTLGRNDKDHLSAEEAEKNIHEVNFDKLIEAAVQEKNYRLAIRFYYLKILKLMSDQKLIEYQYQKTNYEYFYEINNPELKNLFKEISFVFDYCWYGDHFAEEVDFHVAKNKFTEVQNLVLKLQN